MLLDLTNLQTLYNSIKQDCTQQSAKLLILCACDGDALAAARILTYLLRSDDVPYSLQPLASKSMLHKYITRHEGPLLLINCGGTVNLSNLLKSSYRIYVCDSHRPLHLSNVHANKSIVVLVEDSSSFLEEVPSDGDDLSLADESDESDERTRAASEEGSRSSQEHQEEEDQWSSEEEFDDDVVNSAAQNDDGDVVIQETDEHTLNYDSNGRSDERIIEDDDDATEEHPPMNQQYLQEDKIDNALQDSETEDYAMNASNPQEEGDGDGDGDDDTTSKFNDGEGVDDDNDKMTEDDQESIDFATQLEQRKSRLTEYYLAGSFHGAPVSWMMYNMAMEERHGDSNHLLWMSCVGVSDAMLHHRMSMQLYIHLAQDLTQHVQRLGALGNFNTTTAIRQQRADDNTPIGYGKTNTIVSSNEMHLHLLRHWSLFDAMKFSTYIASKIQKEEVLMELLAKMGISLEDAQQPFAFLKPKIRKALTSKFSTYIEEYGLNEETFFIKSFLRYTGYKSLISAIDMSHAISALLELSGGSENNSDDNDDSWVEQGFNAAFDALNSKSQFDREGYDMSSLVNGGDLSGAVGLGAGLSLAMKLQKIVFRTAKSLMEKNVIIKLKHFRYAYLHVTSQGSNGQYNNNNNSATAASAENGNNAAGGTGDDKYMKNIFARPLALNKLACFLMEFNRESGKWVGNRARPLVLISEKPASDSYLIAGYNHAEFYGDVDKNRFGKSFELAAKSLQGCKFKLDSFEGNVIEVGSSHITRFLEQLHYLMDVA